MCIQGSPKWNPRRPKVLKKCKKSCQKLTFGSQKRDVYVRNWREWPLAKTLAGAMFSSHLKVRAPPFLLRNSPRERTAHRERSFSHFWISFWRPRATQGRPRDTEKSPKGLPKPPRGHLKSSEIDVGPHLGIQMGPGRSRGTPGTANDSQIDEKTIKNNSIPHCFFNIFGATLGNTVPQKGEHSELVLTHFP